MPVRHREKPEEQSSVTYFVPTVLWPNACLWLELKYRFGFAYIYMKEIRKKIIGLAEVQIWILLNVYREIRKKNDGSEPKYRFGFA